ncbi:cell division protein FtsN [soil metagenome]
MSYDDNRGDGGGQGGAPRGPYTPPTDDDLPFNRGGFDARRSPPAKAPPVTLIISGVVLLVLIIAVVLFYRSGLRASNDVPPAVGTPVGQLKVEAPQDAQPIDEEAGVDVYRNDGAQPDATAPTYVQPPEAVQPRPEARPLPPVASDELPPARPTRPEATRPPATLPPVTRPPVTRPTAPATTAPTSPTTGAATGSSAVQIGAFSSTAIADREFAAIAGRFPQFSRGAAKRVQEVTAANGSTVYRTTFYGLSRERAQAFCAAIHAAGDDCLVR